MIRFLPSSSNHFRWRFHILTLTSVNSHFSIFIITSPILYSVPSDRFVLLHKYLIFSIILLCLYNFYDSSFYKLWPRSKFPFLSSALFSFFLPSTPRKYESTSMCVTVRIPYFRNGCFWHFRNIVSFVCPQNCWHLHTKNTVNFSLQHAMRHCGVVEVKIYSVLTSVLDWGGWSSPRPLPPRKDPISFWYLNIKQ